MALAPSRGFAFYALQTPVEAASLVSRTRDDAVARRMLPQSGSDDESHAALGGRIRTCDGTVTGHRPPDGQDGFDRGARDDHRSPAVHATHRRRTARLRHHRSRGGLLLGNVVPWRARSSSPIAGLRRALRLRRIVQPDAGAVVRTA